MIRAIRRRAASAAAVLLGAAVLAVPAPAPADPGPPPDTHALATVPSTLTPNVKDGAVNAIAEVGDAVVAGGTFGTVRDPGGADVARPYLFAFARKTGRLLAGFAPKLDGEVRAVLAGPVAGTVYVAGRFGTVNGTARGRVALLRVSDGALVAEFAPPAFDAQVKDLALAGGRLLVGGGFASAGSAARPGLASLHARTGALDGYLTTALTERHGTGDHPAPIGAENLAVSPDGGQLVVIGNFRRAGGAAHDQIVRLDLGPKAATIRDWHTADFTPQCAVAFDHYVRDVAFAPDGAYFVVVTTGAAFPGTLCDTVSRWETAATGADRKPTWVDASGGDTFLSVAVGRSSVFVGGHFRWLNNPNGRDDARSGAVGRAGIAALDPASGLPQAWNGGRNPRGYGADELLLTRDGLWVGSDTEYFGDREHYRGRIGFLPFGATAPHPRTVAGLPGRVYQFGAASQVRAYDGNKAVGKPAAIPGITVDWRRARGAFWVGGTLFHGEGGKLYRRTFDGSKLGAAVPVDPYHDPKWDKVLTGSKPDEQQTYAGVTTTFHTQLAFVTGAFYAGGRLYYTLAGKAGLYWRWFDPDSGTVGAQESAVAGVGGLTDSAAVFVAGGSFYTVNDTTGDLARQGWSGTAPTGRPAVVSGPELDRVDWRSPQTFVGP
ncbi:hypothetical protein GCM10010123_43540 [Pilimelia anulata]|uniref:Uncharacterized protein n=1 Tax=Pilimelia anulata TaxID=53371 RepID=A0A8J3BBR2_9ACTN|nr:hypothetical protein [Pilimelia anulata]GGK08953.1 hypothetical protein GCM10010123_43540 [Pilimelia anulata]